MLRSALPAAVLAATLALTGCSLKANDESADGASPAITPPSGAKSNSEKAVEQLGFPITATRNGRSGVYVVMPQVYRGR